MYYNRAQLKQGVKQSMKGCSSRPMLVTLLFSFVVGVGTALINALGNLAGGKVPAGFMENYIDYLQSGWEASDALEAAAEDAVMEFMQGGFGYIMVIAAMGVLISLLTYLWQSLMNVGYEGYALAMARNEQPSAGKIFCAFPKTGKVLVTRILTGLFILLWSLLLGLGFALVTALAVFFITMSDTMAIVGGVLLAVGIVAYAICTICITLRYALADYALLDGNLSGMEAVRESKRLMKGNVGKLFVLQLSFIGWELLALLFVYGGIAAAAVILVLSMAGDLGGAGLVAACVLGLLIIVAAVVGTVALSLWLKPYITGSVAMFYAWAKNDKGPADAGAAGYDGWSGGYPGQPGGPTYGGPTYPNQPGGPTYGGPTYPNQPGGWGGYPGQPMGPTAPVEPDNSTAPLTPTVPVQPDERDGGEQGGQAGFGPTVPLSESEDSEEDPQN